MELLEDFKQMFKLVKEMATAEGVKEKTAQHWIRIMDYIGQVMDSPAKRKNNKTEHIWLQIKFQCRKQ